MPSAMMFDCAYKPLVRSLFDALALADDEQHDYLADNRSVQDRITFISTWASRRSELRGLLVFLRSKGDGFKVSTLALCADIVLTALAGSCR